MISNQSLRRGIGTGLVVLVVIMPFHAFLSVWLGTITHHETIIEAWKEALLVILAISAILLLTKDAESRDKLRSWPAALIGIFALVALIVTLITKPSLVAIIYGAKTDFEFLVAFLLASIVATPKLIRRLTWAVLVPACIVVAFALLEFTILPPGFLLHFGYSPTTIQPFEVLGGTADIIRYPSTLGGPNQLGTYLMLPFALSLILALRRRQPSWLILTFLCVLASFHAYSRGAWLGLAAAAIVTALVLTPKRLRGRVIVVLIALSALAAITLAVLATKVKKIRDLLFHGTAAKSTTKSSDALHLSSLQTGTTDTLHQPFGHGLGTAGPAVFHAHSGIIIENNFLQLSYETGVAGALLFIGICVATIVTLSRRAVDIDLSAATLAAIIGISVTALFLPAWTDSSTALIVWTAAGACIGLSPDTRHV